MPRHDVLVIGAGISGLGLAHHAARAGHEVLVLEQAPRVGGCLHSERAPGAYWFELGAHTCYNSYGAFLEVIEELGLLGKLQRRGKPVLRFLEGDRVAPGQNLGALLRRMKLWQLFRSLWRVFGASQAGQTVRTYYGRLVGPDNYARVLGPMLSAVPSQRADDFPADMLFKKRPRRKDVMRSFTLEGGLATIAEAIAAEPRITVAVGQGVSAIERAAAGFVVTREDGQREEADRLAIATPPQSAARLLAGLSPALAERVRTIGEAVVDSVGVAVRGERVRLPYASFLIPTGDVFHSVVTRDVVADPTYRAFTFHFQPGLAPVARRERIAALLGLPLSEVEHVAERRTVLPSPALGHHERIGEIDALLASEPAASGRLALVGNWFGGLAIEDCVLRARSEWRRIGTTRRT